MSSRRLAGQWPYINDSNFFLIAVSQSSDNSRQGSPECPEDDDEAKLLYEYLADKHGFQAKDSTPDDDADEAKREKSKTFDEWKADRLQKKNKAQEQEEQVWIFFFHCSSRNTLSLSLFLVLL